MTIIRNPTKIKKNVLTDTDDLLIELNTRIIKDLEKAQETTIKIYADKLKKLKLEVQGKTEKDKNTNSGTATEGIHEAIDDIVTAMRTLTKNLTLSYPRKFFSSKNDNDVKIAQID